MSTPTSTKPYLLRAIYEWCADNGLTPHIVVRVNEHTKVPREHVRDGEIVLNIGPIATDKLKMGNERIEFAARFSGVARDISVPVDSVAAVYARENQQGLWFELSGQPGPGQSPDRPQAEPSADAGPAATTLVPSPSADSGPREPSPPGGGRKQPTLRRVK